MRFGRLTNGKVVAIIRDSRPGGPVLVADPLDGREYMVTNSEMQQTWGEESGGISSLACQSCREGFCGGCVGTIECTCYAYGDEHANPPVDPVYGAPAYSDLDELDAEHDRGGKDMP